MLRLPEKENFPSINSKKNPNLTRNKRYLLWKLNIAEGFSFMWLPPPSVIDYDFSCHRKKIGNIDGAFGAASGV